MIYAKNCDQNTVELYEYQRKTPNHQKFHAKKTAVKNQNIQHTNNCQYDTCVICEIHIVHD